MKLLYSIHKYDVFMFTWLINARIHSALTRSGRNLSKTGDGETLSIDHGLAVLVAQAIENLCLASRFDRVFNRKAAVFCSEKRFQAQPPGSCIKKLPQYYQAFRSVQLSIRPYFGCFHDGDPAWLFFSVTVDPALLLGGFGRFLPCRVGRAFSHRYSGRDDFRRRHGIFQLGINLLNENFLWRTGDRQRSHHDGQGSWRKNFTPPDWT